MNATTATQPSARPIAAEARFGSPGQKSFNRMAAVAPVQMIVSTGTAQPRERTRRQKGVYVPAISR